MMHPNTRLILERCIYEGLRDGYRRAHKHTESPSENGMLTSLEDAIWLHIDELFTFTNVNDLP